MKIAILGSQGVIGSAVEAKLQSVAEFEILSLSRHHFDFRDEEQLLNTLKNFRPQLVINCAGKVGGIQENVDSPFRLMKENIETTMPIASVVAKLGIDKYFYFAPACIYPRSQTDEPLNVSALWQGAPEKSSLPYSTSKLFGVELIRAANREFGFKWKVLLPTNLFGPGDWKHGEKAHVVPMLTYKMLRAINQGEKEVEIWGSGRAKRDFLSTIDLAGCVDFIIREQNIEDEIINIPGYGAIEIINLAEMLKEKIGFQGLLKLNVNALEGAKSKILEDRLLGRMGYKHSENLSSALDGYLKAHPGMG